MSIKIKILQLWSGEYVARITPFTHISRLFHMFTPTTLYI